MKMNKWTMKHEIFQLTSKLSRHHGSAEAQNLSNLNSKWSPPQYKRIRTNTFQHRTGQNSLYFIGGSDKNQFFSSCPSKRRIQLKLEKYGSTSMLRSEYSFKISPNLQRIKSNKNHITRQIISSLPVLVERTNQKTLLCTCPTR